MKPQIVEIEEAVVSYREDVALRGVTLSVEGGEFVGIIGPNGAGKTTLLTIINGLGRLTSGQAWVLGEPVVPRNIHRLRAQVGYVSQVQSIDPRMPVLVREAVLLGRFGRLGLLHHPGPTDRRIAQEALEVVGMEHLAERPVGHLSGGQQQRVAIARALAQEPKILLLDEPTANLDWRAQKDILALVEKIHHQEHLTTFFVTHDLNVLPSSCSRVVMMKEGRIWRQGNPQEMLKEEVLSELYETQVSVLDQGTRFFLVN